LSVCDPDTFGHTAVRDVETGIARATIPVAMPTISTKYFGEMSYDQDALFLFPFGLPAFEEEHAFLPIEMEGSRPLLFLQSILHSHLCFIALPVLVADPHYELAVSRDDLETLQLNPERQPQIGTEVLALTLICCHEDGAPSVNLMAPLVINLANRWAVQAVRDDFRYSHEQELQVPAEEVEAC